MLRPIFASSLSALVLLGTACGQEIVLPDADSMELPSFFDEGEGQAIDSRVNYPTAAASVGLVTVGVALATLVPRAVFAAVIEEEGVREDNEKVWRREFPLLAFDAELHARLSGGAVETDMVITGTGRNNDYLDGFVWYSGRHFEEEGTWTFHDFAEPTLGEEQIEIAWAKRADDDKELTFTNIMAERPEEGDQIAYRLDGTAASMTLTDAEDAEGNEATFSVAWDTETGAGVLTRVTGETACWDSTERDLCDVECAAE